MPEKAGYADGDFCWTELGSANPGEATNFYTRLFGWTSRPGVGGYTVMQKGGKDVAALLHQRRELRALGHPPHWIGHVYVSSADETARRAAELGGTVLTAPSDVGDRGRRALVLDPTGAAFALWERGELYGAELTLEPGAFCWIELYTKTPAAARDFYTGLFGWQADVVRVPIPPYDYTVFSIGDRRIAGMMEIPEAWGNVASHWLVYFGVSDCDEADARARTLGADSIFPPTNFPGVGRLAIFKDPLGAAFAIVRLF